MIQNNSNPENQNVVTGIISFLKEIPVPEILKKNLVKSIGKLITGLVDVPVAYLEAKTQEIKAESQAKSLVTKKAGEAAAKQFGKDDQLIDRSVNYFGAKILQEQINREQIMELALDDLKANENLIDSNEEIDDDWLTSFSRVAETKSNKDVQLFLAKILSGEIQKPGSFSVKTINGLAELDQRTAKIFQTFCNVSFELSELNMICVICDPFGAPGQNSLKDFNLNYVQLTQLQDAGLIQYDLQAWKHFYPQYFFNKTFMIGNSDHTFTLETPLKNEEIKIRVINFTKVGLELRSVLTLDRNVSYESKLLEWLIPKFNLKNHGTTANRR